jgi:hypothetical protein
LILRVEGNAAKKVDRIKSFSTLIDRAFIQLYRRPDRGAPVVKLFRGE